MELIYTQNPNPVDQDFLEDKLLGFNEQKIPGYAFTPFMYSYSFQAREFYEKQGYQVFGSLENYYQTHSKLYMKKVFGGATIDPGKGDS